MQAYKNDQELIPPAPPEVPTPQNIIGFRQRAVRPPKDAPRAILIEAELTNLVIAPLKLLAFSDAINKAIVGIRPRLVHNVALSPVSLVSPEDQLITLFNKNAARTMEVKARLALLSSPEMWATAKLKTRPESRAYMHLKQLTLKKCTN